MGLRLEDDDDAPCQVCADCNYSCTNGVLNVDLEDDRLKHYPRREHPDSPEPPQGRAVVGQSSLGPVRTNFGLLKKGTAYAYHNLKEKEWTKTTGEFYLKTLGRGTKHAKAVSLQASFGDAGTIPMPALWDRGMEINQHLDAYMHMGGGCVKSIIITVRDCLTAAHCWKPFASIINDNILKKLHALQLDWLKIIPFGGGEQYSLGGWVSENLFAYARIIKVLYIQVIFLT